MKKRLLFCFVFVVANTLLSAQSTCMIGLQSGVANSYYVSPDGLTNGGDRLPFYGLNIAGNLRHNFKGKFFWQAGLQYTQFGERILEDGNLRWPSEHDGNGNYVPDPSLPHRLEFVRKTDYFSFRAGLGYDLFSSEKFRMGVMPFAEANFLLSNNTELELYLDNGDLFNRSEDQTDPDFRTVNASAGIALSFQAKVGSKFDLSLSPDVSYQLQSASVNNGDFSDTRRYFAVSLNAGVFYRL